MPFFSFHSVPGLSLILMVLLLVLLCAAICLYGKTKKIKRLAAKRKKTFDAQRLEEYLSTLDGNKLSRLLKKHRPKVLLPALLIATLKAAAQNAAAQEAVTRATLFSQPGVILHNIDSESALPVAAATGVATALLYAGNVAIIIAPKRANPRP